MTLSQVIVVQVALVILVKSNRYLAITQTIEARILRAFLLSI